MSLTNCRYYEEQFPEVDSFVMVNVKQVSKQAVLQKTGHIDISICYGVFRLISGFASPQIAEMGAYVKLLEYDNIDGMILLSELSRRRIRSIQKLIRIGRNEVVVVLRVDKEKGMYMDVAPF